MKKKSFVLSWGRKMFFGLGWALTSLVALSYFQSMILPEGLMGWIYFLTTFVGHYGLILSLVYFLMYCPVVLISPSYYVARIWSITLLLVVNVFILFDSFLFTRFRFHLLSFLMDFLKDENSLAAFGLTPLRICVVAIFTFIVFIIFWLRGERLWRSMQARFSNPSKNWYLVVIVLCASISHLMHMYADADGSRNVARLSNLFPIHVPLTENQASKENGMVYKDFYYSSETLNCPMKNPKNIVMIVLDKWNSSDLDEYQMPNVFHYKQHSLVFDNHYTGGLDSEAGLFSLLYSVPPTYAASAFQAAIEPTFLAQMRKSKMDVTFYKSQEPSFVSKYFPQDKEVSFDQIETLLVEKKELANTKPFFMNVYLSGGSLADKDNQVKQVVDQFIRHKLIDSTILVITGAQADQLKTPMLVIWPGRFPEIISKMTSHYDVWPTIMKESWKCKNSTWEFSYGSDVLTTKENYLHVAGDYDVMKILDSKHGTMTTITQGTVETKDLATMNVVNEKRDISSILEALQRMAMFYRR